MVPIRTQAESHQKPGSNIHENAEPIISVNEIGRKRAHLG